MPDRPIIIYGNRLPGPLPLLCVLEYGAHRISTQLDSRRLDVFGAVLVEQGAGTLRTEAGGEQRVLAPAIFWLWPGMVHAYGPDPGTTWVEQWALFDGRIASDMLTSALIAPRHPLQRLHDLGEMRRLFGLLRVEMGDETALARASAGARMQRIALTAMQQGLAEHEERTERPIAQVVEALRGRAFADIDLIGFANEFEMSPATLRRKFIAATGMPPKALQLRIRLDRAKEMLAITDTDITAIAAETGFADAFYFSRLFAQREGLSPTAFRRRNRRS